jgi:hypothetical protein
MRNFWRAGFALALNLAGSVHAADPRCVASVDRVQPRDGVVSNEKIAEVVALTYLTAIYGRATIRREMPLRAKLSDGVWTVNGTLPHGSVGGTAQMLICQRNGTVLSIIHHK